MLAVANVDLKEYIDSGRIEIAEKDALEFLKNMPEDSMDSVASALTIHNFKADYREEVLKEIFRVLKPGGSFINSDKIMPDDPEIYERERKWQMEQFNNADVPEEIREGWIKHYEIDSRPDIIMREKEVVKMMEEIGFKDIKVSDRHHLEAMLIAGK